AQVALFFPRSPLPLETLLGALIADLPPPPSLILIGGSAGARWRRPVPPLPL
ncbi:hypothetical protein A2U01_0105280, partial [Trifolium medium]|nr:hypothetical protein [Trifolium medium]